MNALAHRVILAGGWQRRIVAFLAGAVGALAMAPFDIVVALVVPMTVAVWLLDGAAGPRRFSRASLFAAFGAGWWWGFGYFLGGLWWLGSAFLLDPDRYIWALPLGVVALPACLAIYTGLGFVLARLLWSPGGGRVLALAAGLGLSEWLRGHLFTGFPWNAFGMALGDSLVLSQAASLMGLYGLTILAVGMAAAPATLTDEGGRRFAAPLGAAALLTALALFGGLRLAAGDPGTVSGVKLRLMQSNVIEDAQFRADNKDAILSTYLALSDRATSPKSSGIADVTHLVWPETALPTILARDPEALQRIGDALPARVSLVTGAFRIGERPRDGGRPRFFNAIQIVAHGGAVLDSYEKVHLVPFGEYLPLDGILKRIGLAKFVDIPGDFEAGVARKLLAVPGLPPVAPLICYEAIFPGAVTPEEGSRPGLLLNVSNDSWFGRTPGPYQHLAQARLRSVEEGLPLVRAATTGLSAVVDPYGRTLASLPLAVADVLDAALPRALPPTVFAEHGSLVAFLLWLAVAAGAALIGSRR